jgi:hypothetical protein
MDVDKFGVVTLTGGEVLEEADKLDLDMERRMVGVRSDSRAFGSCNCIGRPMEGL